MTSSTTGPGVQRFREMHARGDLVDAAALARQYPDEALALADEIRRDLNHDVSITREEAWLARIEALRAAGEDVSLGTSIRGERTGRGLTVAALAREMRERGVNITAAELRRIEANAIDEETEYVVWRALIEELNFEPHTIVAELRAALSDGGMADVDIDSYLERVRGEIGLPTDAYAHRSSTSPTARAASPSATTSGCSSPAPCSHREPVASRTCARS